jgi:SAM-dependent methyltransferase
MPIEALERLSLLSVVFRFYQRISALSPRAYLKNRQLRASVQTAIPPARLLMTVAGSPEIAVFLNGGRMAADSIRETLQKNQIEINSFRAILDFGCGCGRVLRFWSDLKGVAVHGTDYNRELAGWCARNLSFARIGVNELSPPTNYPDGEFDFIYALSVFTHLTEAEQTAWMGEFHRILRPGGYLLLTLHGSHYLFRLTQVERLRFLAGNLVTRHGNSSGTNLCNAFHPEPYVRERLTRGFEVADFVPKGARGNPHQDLWLIKRI